MVERRIVDYVAALARVKVTDREKEFLDGQLSKILEYIDKLKELDVEGIDSLRGLHLENNIFRNDEIRPFCFGKEILNNSPCQEDGFFKIPKVIE